MIRLFCWNTGYRNCDRNAHTLETDNITTVLCFPVRWRYVLKGVCIRVCVRGIYTKLYYMCVCVCFYGKEFVVCTCVRDALLEK